MKKLFTLLLVCFAFVAVHAQSFHEDFNNGIPQNWTVIDNDADGYSWIAVGPLMENLTSGYYTGSTFDYNQNGDCVSSWSYYPTSYSSEGFGGTSLNSDNWLISPVIIPSATSSLSFYTMSFNGTSYPDALKVMIAPNGGNTVADFTATAIPLTTVSWSQYQEETASLADYAGQSIRIAFVHQSNDQFGLLIDEVSVSNVNGINEVETSSFTIYPNPATDILTVNGEGLAEVYNTLGQMVISENVNGTAQLNVNNLESGVYFVRMNGATQRFIKK